MPSVYRTALGKQIDIDKVRLLNEDTVAIGNMRVNARGDALDRNGQILESKDERVANSRPNKTYNAVVDEPVSENAASAPVRRSSAPARDNTAELQATIEKLQRELAEKNAQLLNQEPLGKTLREAVADTLPEESEEVAILTPTNTADKPARGGLAAAIQKNMELQAKKTKPKRI